MYFEGFCSPMPTVIRVLTRRRFKACWHIQLAMRWLEEPSMSGECASILTDLIDFILCSHT